MPKTDVLILGGGLSGLAIAKALDEKETDFILLEARDRLGGRILSARDGPEGLDMGPAWFWPGQPRIAALIDHYNLSKFDQYSAGAILFEDERGRIGKIGAQAAMQRSFRLAGGLSALTDAMAAQISPDRLIMDAAVTALSQEADGVAARTADGRIFSARHVVLALPPRLAATMAFSPDLPAATRALMENVPTWMAGQAKAMIVYDTPFWRDAGLSGNAMSRFGPLVEIHDASPADGSSYALFGFVGISPQARRDEAALRSGLLAQIERLFGPQTAAPRDVIIKDWAQDPFTATAADLQPLYEHPRYGRPTAFGDLLGGRAIFAGTETAPQFGGYLEGALEAAEYALTQLEAIEA